MLTLMCLFGLSDPSVYGESRIDKRSKAFLLDYYRANVHKQIELAPMAAFDDDLMPGAIVSRSDYSILHPPSECFPSFDAGNGQSKPLPSKIGAEFTVGATRSVRVTLIHEEARFYNHNEGELATFFNKRLEVCVRTLSESDDRGVEIVTAVVQATRTYCLKETDIGGALGKAADVAERWAEIVSLIRRWLRDRGEELKKLPDARKSSPKPLADVHASSTDDVGPCDQAEHDYSAEQIRTVAFKLGSISQILEYVDLDR